MTILILGVALWWAAHLFKRIAPERRAAMGDRGKGLVALVLLLSVLLMWVLFKFLKAVWQRLARLLGKAQAQPELAGPR